MVVYRPHCAVLLVWLIAGAALSGCGVDSGRIGSRPTRRMPSVGYVDVAQLEELDPNMPLLSSIDEAMNRNNELTLFRRRGAKDLGVNAYVAAVSHYGSVALRRDVQEAETKRLKELSSAIVSALDERLTSAEELQIEALKAERTAEGANRLAAAESSIQANLVDKENAVSLDDYRVASLKMQIAALQIDEEPPRNAPVQYWSSLLAVRQVELASLISNYGSELGGAEKLRDQLIEQASATIQQENTAAVAAVRQTADKSRLKALGLEQDRFNKERRTIELEDNQVFAEAQNLARPSASFVSLQRAEPSLNLNSAGSTEARSLIKLRTALRQTIAVDAARTIDLTARRMNVVVVEKRPGVRNLTPLFVQAVKDEMWKVS